MKTKTHRRSWHYQRLNELDAEDKTAGNVSLHFENDESGRVSQALQGMAIDGAFDCDAEVKVKHKARLQFKYGPKTTKARPYLHFYATAAKRSAWSPRTGPRRRSGGPTRRCDVPRQHARGGPHRLTGHGELWATTLQMTIKKRQ